MSAKQNLSSSSAQHKWPAAKQGYYWIHLWLSRCHGCISVARNGCINVAGHQHIKTVNCCRYDHRGYLWVPMQFLQVFLALLIETVSVLYHSLQAIELCKKNDTATKDEATSQSVSNAIIMIKWENNLIVLPDEQREVVGVNLQVHSSAPSSSLWTQPPLQHLFPVKGPKFYTQTIRERCQQILGKTFWQSSVSKRRMTREGESITWVDDLQTLQPVTPLHVDSTQ